MKPLFAFLLAFQIAAQAGTFHVSIDGRDTDDGSAEAPWRTVQRAVDAMRPGDTVLIGPGTYRERVEIRKGGTEEAPLTLSAIPGARVVISGADQLSEGWSPVPRMEGVFSRDWTLRFPIDGPEDLTHPDDRAHALVGRAEQVIQGTRLLRQVPRLDQIAPGAFHVDLKAAKLYVWLHHGGNPTDSEVEASTRTQWLAGAPGASHVRIRGITFRHAANHAQRGAFLLGADSRDWVVEDCVFERANGSGATFTGRSHVIRRCVFQDNGQLGFGASSCHDTVVERSGIYRNNTKGYATGWEAGGAKITLSRGFALRACRALDNRGPGIWFDIGNESAEISHCYIADNDEAGIFYEISYGLHAHDNLIVNNANLGEKPGAAWGNGGITLSSSEDCVVEHNTLVGNRDGLAFREQDRSTPRIGGGEQRIVNRNHRIRNNLIALSPAYNVAFWFDTPFFDRRPDGKAAGAAIPGDPATLGIRFENNLLFPLPGRANYLYGCVWRARSKTARTSAEFTDLSGIEDDSQVADPRFIDPIAGDFRLHPDSPALASGVGIRSIAEIPLR